MPVSAAGGANAFDWAAISTIVSSVALIVAFGVFAVQLTDRRRRQASKVSGWVTGIETSPTATAPVIHFIVANHSDEPVSQCHSLLYANTRGDRWAPAFAAVHGVLAPHEEREETVNAKMVTDVWKASNVQPGDYPMVVLSFVDASGRGWTRGVDGALLAQARVGPPWWRRVKSRAVRLVRSRKSRLKKRSADSAGSS